MDIFDARSLIEQFKVGIQNKEKESYNVVSRFDARYPMITVFMNDGIDPALRDEVIEQMEKMWPAYTEIFKYYIFDRSGGALQGIGQEGEALSPEQIQTQIIELLKDETHFKSSLKMVVNYIIDADSMKEGESLDQYFEAIPSVNQMIGFQRIENNVILLLNEQLDGGKKAADIKDELGGLFCKDGSKYSGQFDVYVASNVTNEGKYVGIERVARITADILTLLNDDDAENAVVLKSKDVKAVGFKNVEKPVNQMAQISTMLVSGHLDRMMKRTDTRSSGRIVGKGIEPALGRLLSQLPPPEVLEHFPRYTSYEDEIGPVEELSFDEFNALTMGAWETVVFDQLKDQQSASGAITETDAALCEIIRKSITDTYSVFELKEIGKDQNALKALYEQVFSTEKKQGIGDTSRCFLLQDTEEKLKSQIIKSDHLWNLFLGVVQTLTSDAEKLIAAWDNYIKSLSDIGMRKEDSLEKYYGGLIDDYFRTEAVDIETRIKDVNSEAEMKRLLDYVFDSVIQHISIYGMPFEEELKTRLVEEASPQDVQNNILEALSGNEVYFSPTHTVFTRPALSTIFTKRGSEIVSELKRNMPDDTLFIDTSNGDSIDALQVYNLEYIHLVK